MVGFIPATSVMGSLVHAVACYSASVSKATYIHQDNLKPMRKTMVQRALLSRSFGWQSHYHFGSSSLKGILSYSEYEFGGNSLHLMYLPVTTVSEAAVHCDCTICLAFLVPPPGLSTKRGRSRCQRVRDWERVQSHKHCLSFTRAIRLAARRPPPSEIFLERCAQSAMHGARERTRLGGRCSCSVSAYSCLRRFGSCGAGV